MDLLHLRLSDAHPPKVLSLSHVPQDGSVASATGPYAQLLADFPTLGESSFRRSELLHEFEHYIHTKGPPVHSRARRLPPDELAIAKEEFRNLEQLGIVRRSNSLWSSPLHMVPKSSDGWRPCGDFRRLNDITVPDRFPVPHIQDFSTRLAGCAVFSKIDLERGYHQVSVAPRDVISFEIIFCNLRVV